MVNVKEMCDFRLKIAPYSMKVDFCTLNIGFYALIIPKLHIVH